jgi:hypothetical protein
VHSYVALRATLRHFFFPSVCVYVCVCVSSLFICIHVYRYIHNMSRRDCRLACLQALSKSTVHQLTLHTYTHTHTHTYIHTHTHTYTHTYIHTYIHTLSSNDSRLALSASSFNINCASAYLTYIHTYIHTHIHTHTYI